MSLIRFSHLSGYGAGFSTLRNLLLVGAARGIEMGTSSGESTCDTIVAERLSMQSLGVGFLANTGQSVLHRFNMLRAVGCAQVVRFAHGGIMDLDTAEIIDCGGAEESEYAFEFLQSGPNLRCSRLTCIRIQGTQKFLRIAGDHRIAIDSFTEAQKLLDGEPIIAIEGGAATFHASSFQTLPVMEWEADSPRCSTIRFRDCWFDVEVGENDEVDPADIIDSPNETDCFYSFERCDGQDNVPFKDMDTAW